MRESSLTLSKELPCCLNGNLVEGASNKCPLPNCLEVWCQHHLACVLKVGQLGIR